MTQLALETCGKLERLMTAVETSVTRYLPVAPELRGWRTKQQRQQKAWTARGSTKRKCVTPDWLVDGKFHDRNETACMNIGHEFQTRDTEKCCHLLRIIFPFILTYFGRWKLSQIFSLLVPSCFLFCICPSLSREK